MTETAQSPVTMVDSTVLFEKALHSWSAIDLSSLQKELDSQALEIQDHQKESLLGRKELATQTKDFKKLSDEEKLENFNKLLKSYQNVIDSMNKKTKNVENLFFKVYRAIAEAPDPKPLLKSGMDNIAIVSEMSKLKAENISLEEKLLQYADYNKLKEAVAKTESQMQSINDAQLQAKENEWKSLLDEKESHWVKTQTEQDEQIEALRKQIQEHEINEKMLKLKLKKKAEALGEEFDEGDMTPSTSSNGDFKEATEAVDSSSINSLKKDLESAQNRVKSLQERNEELRREVSTSNSKVDIEVKKSKQENDRQIQNLESENSLIIAKLEHERKVTKQLKEEIKLKETQFESEISHLSHEITVLKEFKARANDYEEVKQELNLLKQIQFGDDGDLSDADELEGDSVAKIESAIVQRNKKLNSDLTDLRRKNEESVKRVAALDQRIKEYEEEMSTLRDSNARLENDLINFDHTKNGDDDRWETMSMISSVAGGSYSNKPSGKISPAASIAGGNSDNRSIITTNNSQESSTLLPIITQQRDRFRSRNKELEEENKKHFSKIVELKREINSLKNDNRELYEKIRFLQYHKTAQQIKDNGGDIENKYKSDYEQDLHPIEQFRIMETKRINSKITPWDRIFIQVTKTILSTQYTRWLFVAYCLSLHLLVMILTMSLLGGSGTVTHQTSSPLNAPAGWKNGVDTSKLDSKVL